MAYAKHPCDDGVIKGTKEGTPCLDSAKPWILAATILGSSMAQINSSTVNVALPALQESLGANVVDIQWVVNAYTLFLAALILLGGSLGDHFGRNRIFMLGVALFAGAAVWCGLAPSVTQLIIARGVQGVGGALLVPGSLAIISASFPAGERGRAIGLWAAFSAMTSGAGPVLGGWLIDTLSWRWIFFVNIPFAVAVIAIAWWRVPESRDDEVTGGLDWWGAALATVGLGGITYGFLESSNRGFGNLSVIAAFVIGVLAVVAFVVVERRLKAPMVPLKLFTSKTFSGANLLTVLLYAALGGALFFLPLNLIQVQGYSATAAGAALLPFIVLMSLLSSWSGGLIARFGAKLPLTIGPVIVAAGFLLFTLPGTSGSYWTTFFPAISVMGFGMAISVAPLTTAVMNAVATHYAGTASGINNAASRVAGLLAVAIFGVVMVIAFGSALRGQLEPLNLSEEVRSTILSNRADLASIQIPEEVADIDAVQTAINEAFVYGFRVVMLISAALAALSALIAWVMIEGKVAEQDEAQDETAHPSGEASAAV